MKLLKFLPLLILLIAIAGFGMKHFSNAATRSFSQYGTVTKVADGDTLTVDLDGKLTKIRLCGIDAPEQQQALGKESKALLQRLALGKEVAVTEIERDRYGRMVAEVFVTGDSEQFVNSDLVEAGLAYHYEKYSGDCPNKEVIVTAESIAQSKKAGVWAKPNSIKPWDYRKTN
ncbi:MAG: thermonuclease family protein [Leptolyngbyaceae cyanobacterium bins.302]|nr:thermonuclease family protein [Leptolyngbyaceae cyanobacterium bins.302]